MKADNLHFLKFLNGNRHFIIPIYQRTYSWTREQCEQLWNDIVRTAQNIDQIGHFIGSIVYIQESQTLIAQMPEYLVIDGQQRLTTLSLLLIALAQAIRKSGTPQEIDPEYIYESFLINRFGKDEQRYKLLLTQSDKDILNELIDYPERAKSSHPTASLIENYRYFEDQIRREGIALSTLFQGISKLIIVEISLDRNHDNPQLIFESLNSTGMDLSQADLIRNYVLMGLQTQEQAKLYKDYWYPMEQNFRYTQGPNQFDRFMRDYLTLKQGAIPNIDRVYNTFKTYHHIQIGTPMQAVVADIYRYAEYYANIAFPKEKDQGIHSILRDIKTLKVDVVYPFLLEVYDDYVNKKLLRQDFIAILKLIESYVFRRAICGIPTQSLNNVFANLAEEIDKEHYLESLQFALLQKDSYRRFPNDDEFRAAFVVKDVYNFRSRNYLLSKLENYEHKVWANVEDYTIEHIMPQNENVPVAWQQELGSDWKNVHAQYLHTIGNLTLTGYNSEMSDRPFLEKRDMKGGFADSHLRLNDNLAKLDHWNKDELERRAQALAIRAVQIWSFPRLSSEQLNRLSKKIEKPVLAEVIGPSQHSLADFIPEGFKVTQIAEKRFHLYRSMKNEWVQYGDGQKPWYAISWPNAGKWARDKLLKQEMPLGVGGTKVYPATVKLDTEILVDDSKVEANVDKTYTLSGYRHLQGPFLDIFEHLRRRILNLDASVKEVFWKYRIVYKITNNFVAIEPKKKRLVVVLFIKFTELDDPKELCNDLTGNRRSGNGDVGINVTSPDQLDDVMFLVRQSFEKHWEEDNA